MTKRCTFYELTPLTQAKWEKLARSAARIANDEGGPSAFWTRDDIVRHIQQAVQERDGDFDNRRPKMYLERMRLASVLGGPDTPSLDLVRDGRNISYRWLYDGKIPSSFIDHILKVSGGMPRIAFDYLMALGAPSEAGTSQFGLDELVDGLGAVSSLLLITFAEFYVRIARRKNLRWAKTHGMTEAGIDSYLAMLSKFKIEVEAKIDPDISRDFNDMSSGLLLAASSGG